MTTESRQRSREDVVTAAGRLFAERGFHGTSMRDLGSELGLLGSSLYSHVAGKQELLVEVVRRGAAMFQALADEVLAIDDTATAQLRRLIRGHISIVIENLDQARTILNEARFLPPEERTPILEMRDRYESVYRSVVERGIDDGEFDRDLDPSMTAIHVLSLLNAIERWYRPQGHLTPDAIAGNLIRFVEGGLQSNSSQTTEGGVS